MNLKKLSMIMPILYTQRSGLWMSFVSLYLKAGRKSLWHALKVLWGETKEGKGLSGD